MVKKKGLGRGLDALLSMPAAVTHDEKADEDALRQLPVEHVHRGRYQPRAEIDPDSLEELASSIRAQGVVQPIVVRPRASGEGYEIVAGERRWRAAQLAGLSRIPAMVRDVPDRSAIAMALIENIQREDLNPMEEALALRRLIDEFDMTHQDAADAVGRSRATVTNLLRLLELNSDVKELLMRGELEMGHARALLGLSGPSQSAAAREVVAKALSARETERLVNRLKTPGAGVKARSVDPDPDVKRLQDELSERLCASVSVQHGARGKGRVVIHYNSLDELDGILAQFR